MLLPYRIAWITHKQHHANANDPELDHENQGDTWWLPRHIAMTYIQLFLSWAPHHPMKEKGRYRDTRAWKSPVGTILSMGMEYHIIHHLFPRIPLFQTGPAYHEIRGLLDERGCPNDRPD